MRSSLLIALLMILSCTFAMDRILAEPTPEQKHLDAPRADGKTTPLHIYTATGSNSGCAPLAVISHGAGGSEEGYRYLGEAMSQLGYTAVVMGHRESGLAALRAASACGRLGVARTRSQAEQVAKKNKTLSF